MRVRVEKQEKCLQHRVGRKPCQLPAARSAFRRVSRIADNLGAWKRAGRLVN